MSSYSWTLLLNSNSAICRTVGRIFCDLNENAFWNIKLIQTKSHLAIYFITHCRNRVDTENGVLNTVSQGLAEDLSKEGACDRAIFPDTELVVKRCAMIGNLTVEGVSKFFS